MSDILDDLTITADPIISIRLTVELNAKAESAAKETGLKKADVIRLALDRGVDVLLSQLSQPVVEVSP